ncbi:MAG: hypothetical protein COA38_11765 [Fluviicola sp.]|nr:MAG: hypothetical protein COA38_11765 [Fluviicola sp.]
MRKITFLAIILTAVSFVSCKKYFDDVNTDPNSPIEVTPSAVLPGIEAKLSYALAGDGSRYSTILNQQIKGVSRQWAVLENYNFVGEDVNTLYEVLYADVLQELKELQKVADRDGLNHYNGIAKTLEAYTLLFIADHWDSSPYSDAFQGIENLQPLYDNQQELYAAVFSLLSNAREDFAQPAGPVAPGSDDLIYQGSVADWISLTNFIEARANLRLAKNDPSKYQDALTLVSSGLTRDFAFEYTGGNFAHPMYQFNEQRGDCSIGTRISELLVSYSDPRDALFNQPFDDANTYITRDLTDKMATLVEQKFIEAECTFQVSGAAAAHPIYLSAITMALESESISPADIATYLGQVSVDPGAANITLEHIMNQKYLGLFLHCETFTDWRRTGFPTLTPNAGSTIPRRFPVPQSERNLNSVNIPAATIYSLVNWE